MNKKQKTVNNDVKKVKKGVAVMIISSRGEILLMKRGPKSRYEPGTWEQCGGVVEEGEDFWDTAKREAMEELGVDIKLERELLHDTFSDMGDGVEWEVKVFEATTTDTPKIQEPDKCVELKWVKQSELTNMKGQMATHLREDFEKLGWI